MPPMNVPPPGVIGGPPPTSKCHSSLDSSVVLQVWGVCLRLGFSGVIDVPPPGMGVPPPGYRPPGPIRPPGPDPFDSKLLVGMAIVKLFFNSWWC